MATTLQIPQSSQPYHSHQHGLSGMLTATKSSSSHAKVIGMLLLIICDIGLNSSLDYDVFNDSIGKNILLSLYGVQIVVQISIFLILFSATADTFLFRVGLIEILYHVVKYVLVAHPIYFGLTLAEGAYRVHQLSNGVTLAALWKNKTFVVLSFVQKFAAIPYYLLNLRTTVKLADPIFLHRETWINFLKQRRAL